ncbi:unnamed protein product [Danaus chrysippus]|uniref:(African queen) hypothetical protein n=1 Tax=Danaus chrysippus TaxID=151541 RepID=A0A8J2W437_9NEOP|nr:unnamed protein product [Danaus chrysippus]
MSRAKDRKNAAGVIHYSFLRPGETITAEKYCQYIDEMHGLLLGEVGAVYAEMSAVRRKCKTPPSPPGRRPPSVYAPTEILLVFRATEGSVEDMPISAATNNTSLKPLPEAICPVTAFAESFLVEEINLADIGNGSRPVERVWGVLMTHMQDSSVHTSQRGHK